MTELTITETLIRADKGSHQLDFSTRNGFYSISVFDFGDNDGARIFLDLEDMKEFLENSLRIINGHEIPTETEAGILPR